MNKKTLLTIGVVALIAVLAVAGASAAWLTSSDSAENEMKPATVEIGIDESHVPGTPGTGTKTICIENLKIGGDDRPGTYAYIRVAIIPVWRNSDKVTGSGLPTDNVKLSIVDGTDSNWFPHAEEDGYKYYYYKNPVAPDSQTGPLIVSYEVDSSKLGQEYIDKELEITVLASAVQAIGDAKYQWLPKTEADSLLTSYDAFIAEPTEP